MHWLQKLLAISFVSSIAATAAAETYRDIGPLDTLGDVKSRFPSADVKRLTPAWAQPTDAMYEFTGTGLSGSIIIKFDDDRPNVRRQLEGEADESVKEFLQKIVNQSDDSAFVVGWVRWIPDAPFPFQRMVSKYGQVEVTGFSDENFQPYREWKSKGVVAALSDDEKNVVRIDFYFTRDEYRKAYLAKYNALPNWLKDKPEQTKKK